MVGLPLTQARDRPSVDHLAPDDHPALVDVHAQLLDPRAGARRGEPSNAPSTTALAGARAATSWLSARPPSSRPSASTSMDLPAPVSPVSTFRPGRGEGDVGDGGEVADAEFGRITRSVPGRRGRPSGASAASG